MTMLNLPADREMDWTEASDVCPELLRKMDQIGSLTNRSEEWRVASQSLRYGPAGTDSVHGTVSCKSANNKVRIDVTYVWTGNDDRRHRVSFLEAVANDRFEIEKAHVKKVLAGATSYTDVSTQPTQNGKKANMATTAAKKAPAKKAPAKKAAPAKPVAKKAPAKKAAATSPAKKSAGRPALSAEEKAERAEARAAAAAERREAAEARRTERAEARATRRAEIVRLRDEERKTWKEIKDELGIFEGTAIMEYNAHHMEGEPEAPTPAKVKKDRDTNNLSWMQLRVKYDTNIGKLQKLYREAGGDTRTSDIGRGGRGIVRDPNRVRPAKAAKAAKESAPLTYVFTGEESDEDVIKKVTGKNITWEKATAPGQTDSAKVKSVKTIGIGKKSGEKVLAFIDQATGAARNVNLTKIVKVGGRA